MDFYKENMEYYCSKILSTGDIILLASGGHGFEMIEDAELIEIKQGPYLGENDKTRFSETNKEKLLIGEGVDYE